jgi:hypothetical protein
VWEISEVDTKFVDVVKLVSPKDLGFWEPKVSKCLKLSMQAHFIFSVLGDASWVSGANGI